MIGDTILMLRDARGLTQEQLAAAIGVSGQAVEKFEDNVLRPGTEIMTKLAKCFGVTRQEIINGYSLLYDDEHHEIVVVRNMGGNRIRVIGRIRENAKKATDGAPMGSF